MKNILILTKNYFSCALGTLLGKKKRTTSGVVTITALFIGLFALLMLQAYSNGMLYAEINQTKMLLFNAYLLPTVLVIFFSLQRISGGTKSNDAEILLSLPLSRTQIVCAKATAKYMLSLATTLLFMMPYTAAYLYFAGFSLKVLLASVIMLLLIPMLAVAFNYILDYITIMLFKKIHGANIFRSIFILLSILAFLAVYIIVITSAQTKANAEQFIESIAPVAWMIDFTISLNLTSLLKIMALCLIPFVLSLFLFSTIFDKQTTTHRKKTTIIRNQPHQTAFRGMLRKEISHYISTPIYLVNTIIGAIMIITVSVAIAIVGKDKFSSWLNLPLVSSADTQVLIITMVFCFSAALTYASACSISLEGKNFWILKTMPISTSTVLLAKIALNLLLTVPAIILSCTILFFALNLTALQLLFMLALPLLISITISFIGLFINLLYPKFDWESEASVVKQSMSTMITSLLSIFVGAVPLIIFFAFPSLTAMAVCAIVLAIYAALAVLSVTLTMTKGKSLYEKL